MSDIKFGVGSSTNWDPKVAGVEATVKALEQVNYKPKFLLIFCTIHYAKEKGGLQKLLAGCRSLVEDDIPSIGGTVTGFICPEGCHTRGVAVVAGSGNFSLTVNCGKGASNNPITIGKKLGKALSEHDSGIRKNKLVIEFSQGPTEPKGYSHIINLKIFEYIYKNLPKNFAWYLRDMFTRVYLKLIRGGPGNEEEILHAMAEYLPEHYLIGCSMFDDMKILHNYQFYNEVLLDRSTVALMIALDEHVQLERRLPIIPTNKKFRIKRGWNDFSIDLIDGHPAVTRYFEEMGWPKEYIKPHIRQLVRETFYYPFGFREGEQIYPFPAGFFFYESIMQNRKIKKDEIELFLTSGKKTLEGVEECLQTVQDRKNIFTFTVFGFQILNMLGEKINRIKEIMDNSLNKSPYLMLFDSGEHSKKPHERVMFTDYGIVMMSILGTNEDDPTGIHSS
jgi:hypothetical protein